MAGYRNRKPATRPKSGKVIPVSHCQAYENLAEIKNQDGYTLYSVHEQVM